MHFSRGIRPIVPFLIGGRRGVGSANVLDVLASLAFRQFATLAEGGAKPLAALLHIFAISGDNSRRTLTIFISWAWRP